MPLLAAWRSKYKSAGVGGPEGVLEGGCGVRLLGVVVSGLWLGSSAIANAGGGSGGS